MYSPRIPWYQFQRFLHVTVILVNSYLLFQVYTLRIMKTFHILLKYFNWLAISFLKAKLHWFIKFRIHETLYLHRLLYKKCICVYRVWGSFQLFHQARNVFLEHFRFLSFLTEERTKSCTFTWLKHVEKCGYFQVHRQIQLLNLF